MSALRIESLPKRRRHGFCVNRCRDKANGGLRAGAARVWILGYVVGLLCARCAKEWPAMWERALDGAEDEARAA